MRTTPEPLTETEQVRRGDLLAEVLKLKHDRYYEDRWQTTWGTKTSLGLFRMIERIVIDGE